jgi:hypothetical protein
LVPVAATAMSLNFGNCASCAAISGTLLEIATSACARRSATCSGGVDSCSCHCSGSAGARIATGSVPRSRKTIWEGGCMRAAVCKENRVHYPRKSIGAVTPANTELAAACQMRDSNAKQEQTKTPCGMRHTALHSGGQLTRSGAHACGHAP